jgi:hypothetical protein
MERSIRRTATALHGASHLVPEDEELDALAVHLHEYPKRHETRDGEV